MQEHLTEDKNSQKKKKTFFIISLVVLVIIMIAMVIVLPYMNNILKYHKAQKCLENKNYNSAITEFQKIAGYKDVDDKILIAKSKLSVECLKNEDYENAISISKELLGYNSYKEMAIKNIYKISEIYYNQCDFYEAKTTLKLIEDDFEINSLMKKIDLLISLQGCWYGPLGSQRYVEGFTMSDKIGVVGGTFHLLSNDEEIMEDGLANQNKFRSTYYIKDGKMINRFEYLEDSSLWSKAGEVHEFEYVKKDIIRIGMTKEEVLNTIWGKPEKVNKTTTKNTVNEQWVYTGNRYLYFENGILTAIQE